MAVRSGKSILLQNGRIADFRILQAYDTIVKNYRTWPVLSIFNQVGDTLWTKQFTDTSIFWLGAQTLIEMKDSGFVLVADKEISSGINNPVLIRTDNKGNEMYRKEIKTSKREVLFSVIKYPTVGFVLGGYGNSPGTNYNAWVIRVNDSLNIEWSKYYESNNGSAAIVSLTKDSSILVCTDSLHYKKGRTPITQKQILRIDSNGIVNWRKTQDRPNDYAAYNKAKELKNEKIVVLGSYFEGSAALRTLTKLTPEGDTIWMNRYYYESPTDQNYLWDFISTSDGGFLLGGDVSSTSGTGQNLWLLKVDSNGCSTPSCTSRVYDIRLGIDYRQEANTNFKVFPNPVKDQLNIEQIDETSAKTNWTYRLINANGKELQMGLFSKEKILNTSNLSSGVYLLKLENGPVRKVYRVVKE